jgi:anti-anti-sigma factor
LPVFAVDVVTREDGSSTVSVAGELDLASVDEFSHAVRTALAAGSVVIDLRGVSFMDSAGIRALNTAVREAAEADRELLVSGGMQPSVVKILELTGMLELLPVEGAR